MPAVAGMLNTASLPSSLVKTSFAAMIATMFPSGGAPLFALSGMLQEETAVQYKHGFFSKTMVFPQLTLAAAVADGVANVFTVTDSSQVIPNMMMRVDSTGENILINNVIDATHVSVVRGVGTVAAAAISNSVNLYQIGSAFEDGSERPNPLAIVPVEITNYTQIFRNSWALTDSMRATLTIAGDTNVANSRADCAAFHAVDIEKSLWFGQKFLGSRNGKPFHTMDGFLAIVGNLTYYPSSYAAANVFTAGGTTTYAQLESYLDPCFNQSTNPKIGNERLMFCGGTALKVINNIGRNNGTYQLQDGQTSWGLQFKTFKTTRGTFTLIEHPLFNTNATWSKMACAVDLSTYNLAYLGDRKTKTEEYGVNGDLCLENGIDAQGGSLTTEVTQCIKNPPANSAIFNLTAAA